MIERVARAIYESHHGDEWRGGDGVEAEIFRQDARAALEAMREPTEAMLFVGDQQAAECAENDCHAFGKHVWEQMIDAALNPESHP